MSRRDLGRIRRGYRAGAGSEVKRTLRALMAFSMAVATSMLANSPPAWAVAQPLSFDDVEVTANPDGWSVQNLDITIDDSTAGTPLAGIMSGPSDPTGVVIDYTYDEPKHQVTLLRLWNQAGGNLNDQDGIGTALVEVFDDSNNLLFSGGLNAGNGGTPFDTVFPDPLDDVSTVRLSNITIQNVQAIRPLWREFAAVQNVAFPSISTEINSDGVSDDVTVTGTEGLEGTLTWTLLGPVPVGPGGNCDDADWSSAPVFETGTVTVAGDGTVVTAPSNSPTAGGCYSYADVLSSMYYNDDVVSAVGQPAETFFLDEPESPALSIVKTASPLDPALFQVGQMITYTFVVTNTGNVTLASVGVSEAGFTGTGSLSPITCPGGNGGITLDVGEQAVCTASYTLTQADVDQGSIANQARAVGDPPSGPSVVSQLASAEAPGDPQPGLTMVKTADPTSVSDVGEIVRYTFLIENTGNVTLTDVAPEELAFTGTGMLSPVDCPPETASLAPSQQVACTASYQVTQADLDSGAITNVATANGLDEVASIVTSPGAEATVDTPGIDATTPTTAPSTTPTTPAELPFTGINTTLLWAAVAAFLFGVAILTTVAIRPSDEQSD
jgi:uncharacterized repeat protein (TIGR01451 family)